MALTRESLLALALEETDGRSKVFGAELCEKPAMSAGHNLAIWELLRQLLPQLSTTDFQIRQNAGHLSVPSGDSYVPDLFIVPSQLVAKFRANARRFETYSDPLPFVVEVSSPSTGDYDIDRKMPGYRKRGDQEIWRVHPFERHVTIWRRQSDGHYVETFVREGTVSLHAVPGVMIDVESLFVE